MTAPRGIAVVLRLILAIGGGYAVAAGVAAQLAVVLPVLTPLPRSEAVVLASMLAFVIYLAVLISAFAVRRLSHLAGLLVAAGASSWGGAWGIVRLGGGA
ncbi:iron transporter [Reyranella sp.]|uniref:iron transporter n=1 Tax=Reyranella sp. TaxID=1929291 RepID=UPI0011FB6F55|nr:iron transporter [Reyranella sp.]TAJ82119.1 MAG: iron transporter [Reyranella sp.]